MSLSLQNCLGYIFLRLELLILLLKAQEAMAENVAWRVWHKNVTCVTAFRILHVTDMSLIGILLKNNQRSEIWSILAFSVKIRHYQGATGVFHSLWRVWRKILAILTNTAQIHDCTDISAHEDIWQGALSACLYFWITFRWKFLVFVPF